MADMSSQIHTLLGRARRLVSPTGEVEWILLRPEDWEALVELLEDLEDLAVLREIETQDEEARAIPWDEALDMLRGEGVDV